MTFANACKALQDPQPVHQIQQDMTLAVAGHVILVIRIGSMLVVLLLLVVMHALVCRSLKQQQQEHQHLHQPQLLEHQHLHQLLLQEHQQRLIHQLMTLAVAGHVRQVILIGSMLVYHPLQEVMLVHVFQAAKHLHHLLQLQQEHQHLHQQPQPPEHQQQLVHLLMIHVDAGLAPLDGHIGSMQE